MFFDEFSACTKIFTSDIITPYIQAYIAVKELYEPLNMRRNSDGRVTKERRCFVYQRNRF